MPQRKGTLVKQKRGKRNLESGNQYSRTGTRTTYDQQRKPGKAINKTRKSSNLSQKHPLIAPDRISSK